MAAEDAKVVENDNVIALLSNRLMSAETKLADEVVHLGVTYEVVFGEVSLGV
jgi:hypothetical protein